MVCILKVMTEIRDHGLIAGFGAGGVLNGRTRAKLRS